MQYVKGPLLVLAGAGSGKTSLLAYKISWLIREYGVDPGEIVALAASAHTVRALRRRAEETLGRKIPNLSILRFVELGLELTRQRLNMFGLRPGFSLYDRKESEAIIARLLRDVSPWASGLAAAVASRIAHRKRGLIYPGTASNPDDVSADAAATQIYGHYEQCLRAANAVDIDDLLRNAVQLLNTDTTLADQWRSRVRFLLVDEYECVTGCEHALVRSLAARGIPLTAAGDDTHVLDDPGGRPSDYMARFPEEFPDLRVIRLESNFRSSIRIVEAATRVAGGAGPASDTSTRYRPSPGAPLRLLHARNEQHEAESIATALVRQRARSGGDYRDYAIFIRRPEQAMPIERALRAQRVPYHAYGAPSLFEQPEVRDLWAYLRLACNRADDSAFLRALNTPRRDIDHLTLERLVRLAADQRRPLLECALDPDLLRTLAPTQAQTLRHFTDLLLHLGEHAEESDPSQLVRTLLADLRYADWLHDTCNDAKIAAQRMDNVARMIDLLRRFSRRQPGAGLRQLATQFHLRMLLDDDDDDIAADGVALVRLTAARGIEFAHVYIVGFEEGLLPAVESQADIDAATERRLAYLAISRARETVTLTIAEQRRLAGGIGTPRASRFLADLPTQDLEWTSADAAGAVAENTLVNSATYVHRGGHRPR